MKILLTGHQGYIGTILAPMLQRAGHDVTGLDSGLFSHGNLGQAPDDIPTLSLDVRDTRVEQLRDFDAVIHLAGLSNDPLGDLNPECTYDINHRASVRLAELAKQAGVERFLFASSCSLYGAAADQGMLDEHAHFNPVTPYGESKVRVEADVSRMADDRFSPTYLRCATAYGVSPRLRADLVVNNLVGYAFLQGEVLLKSDGTPWRPLVHIEDIARAYVAILHAPRELVHNEAFNVGRTEENYQIRQVAELVESVVPGSEVRCAKGAGPDTRCYVVDCTKIEQKLPEYQPRWTVRDGIEELYQAYKDHELTRDEFLGPKFMRIQQIKRLQSHGRLDADLRWIGGPTDPAPEFEMFKTISRCRSCRGQSLIEVLALGEVPLADGLLSADQLGRPEPRFPLTVMFCPDCALVQLRETVAPELLFGADYPYYSSFSDVWLEHNRQNALELIESRGLNGDSLVVELASNDGYLLKNFLHEGVPVLGIDPAPGPAAAAEEAGVTVLREFFTRNLAEKLRSEGTEADVVIAKNVLAHVADQRGFVGGIARLLKQDGVAVFEVPYVKDLIEHCEFDTIYHEHMCYFSVSSLQSLFRAEGLHLNDVRHLPTHGGSLQVYAEPESNPSPAVEQFLAEEHRLKIDRIDYYRDFADRVRRLQRELVDTLSSLRKSGKRVAAYGAAAKGASLLNCSGVGEELLEYVVDRNRHKHGKFMPGVHRPIYDPERLLAEPPDYLLLLAWNYKDEILKQQAEYHRRGGRFIVPVPNCQVL